MNVTSLKKVVERAVRPVRASKARKLQMRIELLAHLQGLYEQERARLGDDAAAFDAARARFGDPAELSQELDRSVGLLGRFAWACAFAAGIADRQIGYRPDRSSLWHVSRIAGATLLLALVLAILGAALSLSDPRRWTDPWFLASVAPVFLYVISFACVLHATALALAADFFDRPRWGRASVHAALSAGVLTLLFYGVWWLILRDVSLIVSDLPVILAVMAFLPAGLMLAVRSAEAHARPHREWSGLELDQ